MRGKWMVKLLTLSIAGLLMIMAAARDSQPASAGPAITVYQSPT